jgi:hypothetical protein
MVIVPIYFLMEKRTVKPEEIVELLKKAGDQLTTE